MNRTIFCVYLQRHATGLTSVPYPGALGQRIYQEISQEAWLSWQKQQIMLINENQLNMMCIPHRTWLEEQMTEFLFADHNDDATTNEVSTPANHK